MGRWDKRQPTAGQAALPYLERAGQMEGADRRRWQHVPVPDALLIDGKVTATMFAVYAGLARHVQGRTTYMSNPRLQAYTGQSRKTVAAAIASLCDLGYVTIEPRPGQTIVYDLCEVPEVPEERISFRLAAGPWDHVRIPVVLLDDKRVNARALAVWAAAARLSEYDTSAELAIADIAVLADLEPSRSGARTVKDRMDVLHKAGYLKRTIGRGTLGVAWVACPPVPAEHLVHFDVDARPRTPASSARSTDVPLPDIEAPSDGSESGAEGPIGAPHHGPSDGPDRALDAGVNRAPVTGVDQEERAPDAGVTDSDRALPAALRALDAADRALVAHDLYPPLSPSEREGGGGADASNDDEHEPLTLLERFAQLGRSGASPSVIADAIDAAFDPPLSPDDPQRGELLRVALRARNHRAHPPTKDTEQP